ncbi:MAG TPA: MDR family MFS transporter [Eoetvoesiella sp.]
MQHSPLANASPVLSHSDVRYIVIGLMLAILLGAMEQTIVSVSLPMMSADLQGVDLLAWVVSAYLITVAVATPIYGKLGDLYGRRFMLSSAIGIFLLGSVLCALATSMPMLVGSRIVQGIGGGGLISLAQTIIADVVSPRERGRYQGYISGAFAVASVSGPVLGGLLTQYLSWRWIFWINLPLGLATLIISRRALMRLPARPLIKRPIDYLGAILLTIGLTTLLIGITRVGYGAAWTDVHNVKLFSIAMGAMLAFVWQERRAVEPIIPLSLFNNATVTISCAITFIAFIQIISLSVLVPLRLQMLTDLGADGAALQLLPMSLGIPCGSFVAGKLTTRTGRYKQLLQTGSVIVPLVVFALALSDPQAMVINSFCMAMAGLAIGLQLPTSLVAVQNSADYRHLGVATAVIAFVRSLGAAVGIAILMALLLATLQSYAPESMTSLTGGQIINALVGDRLADIDAIIRSQLLMSVEDAFQYVFSASAAIAAISIVLSVLLADGVLSDYACGPASKNP